MANPKNIELCGSCCKGSQPIRKRLNECIVCACGVPFFSQIVVENNLPTSRRCLIEIPMEFMEDHGSKFAQTVSLEEDSEVHSVKIGGNVHVGFGFEWRDFLQSHNIGIGQTIVFTLVARSRFLVQIYKPAIPSPIAIKPQTSNGVEQMCPGPTQIVPKVEVDLDDDDDDDLEVCVAQDWLVAKASRRNKTYPVLVSMVKVEKVFSETLTGQATRAPDKQGGIGIQRRQKCGIVPKMEPVLDRLDASDGIVEASNFSRRKKMLSEADSEIINEGRPMPPKESPVLETPVTGERGRGSACCSSSESEETEDSDTNPSSTSDSAWSPRNSRSRNGRKRGASPASSDSDSEDEDEDEDEDDDEDEDEDKVVLNKFERRRKRLFSEGSSSVDKAKRARLSDMNARGEIDPPSPNDDDGTKSDLLVEGYLVRKHGHDWHVAGTKRGRTYVSKRRPVTEAEKKKTLERARKVHIDNPSFLKQLHKDSCYRSLKLFPPTLFYKNNMVSAAKGSYKAKLVDENGNAWPTRIMGMKIFWKHFTLDHYLEEDDVVVFELLNPRHESVTFRVHIFRVVDVKVTVSGKEGWAAHYNVVEGTKKQYFEERRRLLKAQELKKQWKQKHKRKDGSSSKPKSDTEITEFYRSKKDPEATEFYKRLSASQARGKAVQKEKPAPDPPNASRNQIEPPNWKRPITRIRRRELNLSLGDLVANPIKSIGFIKLENEDDPPLESVGTLK